MYKNYFYFSHYSYKSCLLEKMPTIFYVYIHTPICNFTEKH